MNYRRLLVVPAFAEGLSARLNANRIQAKPTGDGAQQRVVQLTFIQRPVHRRGQ